jgi:transposase-like protein
MNTHHNARLTPKGREDMVRAVVDQRSSKAEAARRFNTTPKTVAKWVDRFKAEGVVGLRDRSSKPLSSPSQIPLATADAVERLRRGRKTQEHIAGELAISKASVSRILKRRGLSLLSSLEPQEPRPRYERETPGEIIHIDIKKLGRFNAIGHRITGRHSAHPTAGAADGSSLTSPSTITPASPAPTSSPTRRRRARWPSSSPPSPTTRASASTSSGS